MTGIRPLLSFALIAGVATLSSCGSDAPTRVSGLHGTFALRSVDGHAVPFAPTYCGGPCTLESGSIEVLSGDSIRARETTSTPPGNGLPGTVGIATGYYFLHRVGDIFALEPGSGTSLTIPVDTLYVIGDSLVTRVSPSGRLISVRIYAR